MHSKFVNSLLFLVSLLAPALMIAQEPTEVEHAPYGGVREWIYGVSIPSVPNLPFTAKVVISSTRMLGDGTQVQRKTTNVIARDSQGRWHNEGRQLVAATDSSEPRIFYIGIYDPQSRTRSVIYPAQRLVRVFHASPSVAAAIPRQTAPLPNGAVLSKVELGTQMAEGLELHGTRETRTFPAGVFGNDRSFEVVDEFWYSSDLKINIIVRHNDPRTGVQTVGVTELTRTEPDAKLFEVPADYRRVEEPSSGIGNVQAQGITPPRKIAGAVPQYTEAARRAKVQGVVIMSVLIGEDGSVENAAVTGSLRPDLDQASLDAVRQWRFQPATKNGFPIPFRTNIETTFRLY